MALEYFCCYFSYRDKMSMLTDEQFGRVIRAAILFAETGEVPSLEPIEEVAFSFLRFDIETSRRKYDERCEKNRANIRKRYEAEPSNTTVYETNENKPKSKSKNKPKSEIENERDKPSPRFAPPTLEDVRTYCQERQSTVSAESFFDFYTANGWKQGQGKPIRDWRAAVRTWERRDRENGKRFIPPENKPEDEVILPF